jgi:hypothetical protein
MKFNRVLDDVTREATLNPEMGKRFIADPKAVLAEKGIELPQGVRITVHEFDPNDKHFFLPPAVTLAQPQLKHTRVRRGALRRGADARPPGAAPTKPFMTA